MGSTSSTEEMLLEAYTPREHLLFQSTLRMPRDVTKAQREQRVDASIKMCLGRYVRSQHIAKNWTKTAGIISDHPEIDISDDYAEIEICTFGVQDALTKHIEIGTHFHHFSLVSVETLEARLGVAQPQWFSGV